jgi:cell fate regulator YaaT (PSP1 superfamily)
MATAVIGIKSGYSGSVVEIPYNDGFEYAENDEVIFKDEEGGEEYGAIKYIDRPTLDADKILFESRVLRHANSEDIGRVEKSIGEAQAALEAARGLTGSYKLDMNVFRCGLSFDGKKIHFMFTAEDRVDFRELVKDLAKDLKKQIHLRQVGPRDKAKMIGGYGKCGRTLCCATWLDKMESINMEMVRAQGLEGKGSAKLSGSCGKLLCCLKYEVEAYKELRRALPRVGTVVSLKKCPEAPGVSEAKVIALDILNQKVKIVTRDGDYFTVGASFIDKVLPRDGGRVKT